MTNKEARELGQIVSVGAAYFIAAPLFAGIVIGAVLPGLPFIFALLLTWAAMFSVSR